MAPPNNQKRVKQVSVFRPFVYGTTARLFDSASNPKPDGVPTDHTHSWTVFVKGVDDTDITYWCKKVQFKLHESIPNHVRTIENIPPGETFEVHETGWGEFEISIKMFYVPESLEKPQTMYHQLRLHPYGDDEKKEEMKRDGEVRSWGYEEMVFNEPYENFYDLLTSPMDRSKGGKGKATRIMKGGMVGSVGERTVTLPNSTRPDQPFTRETEVLEIKRLKDAHSKVDELKRDMEKEIREKEKELARLRGQRTE